MNNFGPMAIVVLKKYFNWFFHKKVFASVESWFSHIYDALTAVENLFINENKLSVIIFYSVTYHSLFDVIEHFQSSLASSVMTFIFDVLKPIKHY